MAHVQAFDVFSNCVIRFLETFVAQSQGKSSIVAIFGRYVASVTHSPARYASVVIIGHYLVHPFLGVDLVSCASNLRVVVFFRTPSIL